jgi:DNA-binding GntR family transcriptional regulator
MPVPESAPLDRDLLRDRAYVALRDAIVEGTLAPGERLRDAELCEWLGLSRTPVREALGRLEQDGLVESAPQRFTRVTPLDRRDARDAFPIVAALHALAAELAVPRLTAADLAAMGDANARFAAALRGIAARAGGKAGAAVRAGGERRGARAAAVRGADVEAALAADDAFHGVFVTASANAELPRALDRLMPRMRRLERARFGSLQGRRSVAQHDAIARAAAAGDVTKTAALVRENWLSLGALIDRTFHDEDLT